MRLVVGIIIAIIGIVLGLYVGIYVLLAGGIMQLLNAMKNDFEVTGMLIGIIKILFCELGGVIAWIGIIVGTAIGVSK